MVGTVRIDQKDTPVKRDLIDQLFVVLQPLDRVGCHPSGHWRRATYVGGHTVACLLCMEGLQVRKIALRQEAARARGTRYNDPKAWRCAIYKGSLGTPHPLIDAFLIQGNIQAIERLE